MLSLIKRIWGRSATSPQTPVTNQPIVASRGTGLDVFPTDEDPGDYAITRYPPFDTGIRVVAIDKLVQSQQELLDRIFRTAGVSRGDFQKLYFPAIENLARHVHLLPATSTTYFRGTGGLFRMSMEIALNSLQSANAAVFPATGGVERRHFMQPKWTLATFLAGLCSQNYRTVNSMAVMTRSNAQWTPLLDHLYDWCVGRKEDVYFVRWMEDLQVHGAQASAAYSISRVVPHEVLQYLASDNNQVVPAMTAAIAGVETNASENPISRLVAPVITRVIEDDLKRSASNYGHLVIGAHLEPHLVDAMRRLVRGGKWIANNQMSGGRVWVGQEGVFIDWPPAAGDISNLLARDAFAGIPKDPDTLADLLVSASLLELNSRGGRYWTIALPGTFEAKEGMVKLKQGEVIFPQGFDFDPYRNVQLTLTQTPAAPAPVPAPVPKPAAQSPAPTAQTAATEKAPAAESKPQPVSQTNDIPSAPAAKERAQNGQAGQPSHEHKKSSEKPKQGPQKQRSAEKVTQEEIPELNTTEPSGDDDSPLGADLGPTTEKLLGSLKRSNAWLLNEVIHSYRASTLSGVVAALPYGFGISHEELNRHGMPVMDLLEELGLKSWLWQDKTRASRRIHPVEVDGKTHRMIILKPDVASGLGFDMAAANKEG